MELKKFQQHWDGFPDISMEERPILSSDLEKIVLKNPLSEAFYLRKKLLARIIVISVLWVINVWQLRSEWMTDGPDLYQAVALFVLLAYSAYFHIRLLLFSDYPTLLSLPLISFLSKLETILDKYILSFKFISGLAGFYFLAGIEFFLSRWHKSDQDSLSHHDWYKWLILIFISVSFDIIVLHTIIPGYRKLFTTVRKYKEGIQARAQK